MHPFSCQAARLAGIVGLGLALVRILGAQTSPPPTDMPPLPPAARAAVDRGLAAAKAHDYLAAIQSFQDARKFAPVAAEIFYNLGEAEAQSPGRAMRAVCWYAAYLTVNPAAPDADGVKNKIFLLEAKGRDNLREAITEIQDAVAGSSDPGRYLADLANLWAEAGDFNAVLNTAKQIDDAHARYMLLQPITTERVRVGDFATALKLTALVSGYTLPNNYSPKDEILWRIAQNQAEAGDIAAAQLTISHAGGFYRGYAQVAIAQAQIKAGDVAGAQRTEGETQGPEAANGYATFKDVELRAIAGAQGRTGDIRGARKTVGQVLSPSYKAGALSDIAEARAAAGDLAGSRAFIAEALVIAGQTSDRSLADVAKAQARTGDLNGALNTVGHIQSRSNADFALEGIVDDQTQAGNLANAQQVAGLIASDSEARVMIASFQAAAGDFSGAKATASVITDKDDQSDAYRFAVVAQAGAGDIAGAKNTADLIQDPFTKCMAAIAIADAQAKAGDLIGAAQTLLSARAAASLLPDATWLPTSIALAQAKLDRALSNAKAGPIAGAPAGISLQPSDSESELYNRIMWVDKGDPPHDRRLTTGPLLEFAKQLAAHPSADLEKELHALIAGVDEAAVTRYNLNRWLKASQGIGGF
jgi:hypothetical protein